MSDLEKARPGKVGKTYPATQENSDTTGPVAQALATIADKTPQWVFLLVSVIALLLALALWLDGRRMASDIQNIRGILENQVGEARDAAVGAAVAAERADKAERESRIALEYAIQIYPQLNRLGYPVKSPGEEHEDIPPEYYEKFQNYLERKEAEKKP